MKPIRPLLLALTLGIAALVPSSHAADPAPKPATAEINTLCPVTGKRADASITLEYEGISYAFADDASRTKWKIDRESSLYHQLGGKPAINAAVDLFYKKLLADDRAKQVFEDVDMKRQIRRQKEFLSAAFGGPISWKGKDLRTAHEGLNLTETHFMAVAQNLQASLEELKVPQPLIAQVMTIAGSVKDDVLNRPKAAK